MALNPASPTVTATTNSTISLLATNPTNGTGPYTLQWQRATDGVSFTNVAGATSLALADTALTTAQLYYYRVNFTDSVAATGTTPILQVATYHNEHGSEGIMRKARLAALGRISGPKRH